MCILLVVSTAQTTCHRCAPLVQTRRRRVACDTFCIILAATTTRTSGNATELLLSWLLVLFTDLFFALCSLFCGVGQAFEVITPWAIRFQADPVVHKLLQDALRQKCYYEAQQLRSTSTAYR